MSSKSRTGKNLAGTIADESTPTSPRTTLVDVNTDYLLIDHLETWDAWRAAADASLDTLLRCTPHDV